MGATITKLASKAKNLAGSIKEYPLESALCITYFLIWVFRVSIGNALKGAGLNVNVEQFFVWFVPQFVLCYALHQFKYRNKLIETLYYLSWFVWIPLLLLFSNPNEWSIAISYLLAGLALIVGTEKMDNERFGHHIIEVTLKLAEGLMIGMLLRGVIYAVVASIDFLFDLSLKEGWYSYPSVFNWLVITPLLCCTLLSDYSGLTKVEKLLRIVVDRVLSTALVIYAVILYGYIFRILVKWELPNGGVAYMVLAFLCVALVCYLLRLQVKNRHYEWFYKFFPAIAVPPLVLLWIGIFRRIGEYGVTEDRFYLLVLAALVTLFVTMLVRERTRRFQLMVLVLAASAILFTFIPGMRARDFGIRSQISRLDKLLPDVLEDGQFPKIVNYHELAKDTIQCKYIEESYGAWTYLKGQMDSTAFSQHYGSYGDYQINLWDLRIAEQGNLQSNGPQPKLWSIKDVRGNIDLGSYTQIVHEVYKQADSLGIAFCSESNHADTLLYCPVHERLQKADESTPAKDVLIYENGSYKAIFWIITDKNGYPSNLINSMSVLFKRPEK
jgi:hypothetical protein